MNDYYDINSKEYFESTFHVDPSSFLSPLASRLKKGFTLLDIGCGSGRDLLWFYEKGFQPTGLERAPNLAELARQNSSCPVIEADFLIYDFSQLQFDALLAIGSFVHLDRKQFSSVLNSVCMGLKNEGYIYLTLKEGEGKQTNQDGRTFTLWQQHELEEVFVQHQLLVLDFSRQVSKIRKSDVWLGYLLQKK